MSERWVTEIGFPRSGGGNGVSVLGYVGGTLSGGGKGGEQEKVLHRAKCRRSTDPSGGWAPAPRPAAGSPRADWALVEGEGAPPCWQEGAQRPKVNLRGGAAASD